MDVENDRDENTVNNSGNTTSNPLHYRGPSKAYMESYMRAQEERDKYPEPIEIQSKPGWRTIVISILLMLGGLIMFIIGLVYFLSSKDKGRDLLIVGSVMLLPGGYSSYVLFGAWMKWRNFSYNSIPSMDVEYFN